MTVLTGAQIRQARELLGWSSVTLARKAKIDYATLVRSQLPENCGGLPPVLDSQVRRTLETAGVDFDNDDAPEPRLKRRPGRAQLLSGSNRTA